jgi:RND superfamily putative drug exporter
MRLGRRISRLAGVLFATTPSAVIARGVVVAFNSDPGIWRSGGMARLEVSTLDSPVSVQATTLVRDIRSIVAPDHALVGGVAADFTDADAALIRTGGVALLWIVIAILVLLFVFTGSVLLPIKAILMNLLSLSASLGVLVWVFQEGHLRWLIGNFTTTGSLDASTVIVVVVVVFALSTDYELFLVSRIQERYKATLQCDQSIIEGLSRSGRIVSMAAVLLAVSLAAFATSSVTNVKMFGFGVAIAIVIDAVVVRAVLVPALMSLTGKWNWWSPAVLRGLHKRVGVQHHHPGDLRPN